MYFHPEDYEKGREKVMRYVEEKTKELPDWLIIFMFIRVINGGKDDVLVAAKKERFGDYKVVASMCISRKNVIVPRRRKYWYKKKEFFGKWIEKVCTGGYEISVFSRIREGLPKRIRLDMKRGILPIKTGYGLEIVGPVREMQRLERCGHLISEIFWWKKYKRNLRDLIEGLPRQAENVADHFCEQVEQVEKFITNGRNELGEICQQADAPEIQEKDAKENETKFPSAGGKLGIAPCKDNKEADSEKPNRKNGVVSKFLARAKSIIANF